jgi:hypothetical protein
LNGPAGFDNYDIALGPDLIIQQEPGHKYNLRSIHVPGACSELRFSLAATPGSFELELHFHLLCAFTAFWSVTVFA